MVSSPHDGERLDAEDDPSLHPTQESEMSPSMAEAQTADFMHVDPSTAMDKAERVNSTGGDLLDEIRSAFGDRYVVDQKLGEGGFGCVYRAFDKRLNRHIALKVSAANSCDHEQLMREARSLAQFRHSGIVAVHDVAVTSKHCFVVSELLPGPNLSQWLQSRRATAEESVHIIAAVADALAHAHARSVIHRDLKPSNIVLDENQMPVLVDFGLALTEWDVGTEHGMVMGTPGFMSPEQARGRGHRPDGRTDIYGLAATLYAVLCRRPPFCGKNSADVLRQVREDEPQPIRQMRADIPKELEQVCLKGMAKRPEDRYTTAGDFAVALRKSVRIESPSHEDPNTLSQTKSHRNKHDDVPTHSHRAQPAPPEAKIAATDSARGPRTERRQVTLLVCTCETGSDEQDDPIEFVTKFQALCERVVRAHGGEPLQNSGTTFLACFGYPQAHEDAPQQAVRAALRLAKRSSSTSAAVATGQAVVTDAAGAAPVVVGDVVAAANAVAAATEPAGVCISDSTYQLVRGRFECESAGELRLRGSASALPFYVVKSISAARNRIDALDPAQLTPLIGRNREVELIKERWDLTCEGVRNVILIVADPGLGKSRLVRVLREHVTGSTDRGPAALDSVRLTAGGHAVLEWYCSPYHQGSPFYPVIDYFERIYHLRDETDTVRRLDILIQRLIEDGIDSPEDQSLIAAMCSIPTGSRLPPLTLSPDRQREKTQDALLKWLETRAASNSVLFVVEDLHWVDPSTESLLTQFVEQADDANILAVFTFRPEYEPPWKGKSAQTQIALNRLTKNQVTEMIRVQAGSDDVPQSVVDQIIERTDGVPLFVEEFMRLAGDHGNGFAFPADAIPTTLQGLLLARLDRMASNREVAQLGAVLGRTFSYRVLQAASDLDEPSLRAELEKLVSAGLLFIKGSYPECSYTFKHALLQDAAYQSLVKKRRQQFHRCVAEALENRFPETCETQPELLARHFTDAGDTQRGLNYWSKAAARARERSAYAEAISHLLRGLEVLEGLTEGPGRDSVELGLRLPLGSCYLATQGYGAADVETQIARSRELCERLGPESPLFNVMMIDWALRFIRGKNKLSQSMCVELEALADARDDSCRTEAHWAWGCTLWWTGEFERSLYHLDLSTSLYRLESAEVHAAFSQQNCGPLVTSYSALALWMLGRPESAAARAESSYEFAMNLKHPFTSCVTTWQVGLFHFLKGDFDKAIELADAAYEIATEQSFAFWTGLPISLKGAALGSLGRQAEAIPMLITGLHMIEATGCEMVHQIYLAHLADAYWATGRRDEAKRALDRAFELTLRDDERYIESELHRRRALFLLDEFPGAVEAAEDSLRTAREIARAQKAKFYELRAVMALSRLRSPEQERHDAAEDLESVMASFVEGFDSPDMQSARALLSSLRDIN